MCCLVCVDVLVWVGGGELVQGNWLAKGCGLNMVGGIPLGKFSGIWMGCVGHVCLLWLSCMVCLVCVEVLVWVGGVSWCWAIGWPKVAV